MNLRNVVISYVVVILFAAGILAFVPPTPEATIAGLAAGAIGGLLLSRWVVLPYLTDESPSSPQ
jgi:hypothetical protein